MGEGAQAEVPFGLGEQPQGLNQPVQCAGQMEQPVCVCVRERERERERERLIQCLPFSHLLT